MNQEFSGGQKMTEVSSVTTSANGNYETSIRARGVKISAAIHMVTDLVSDVEPIRHELRRGAIDLVSLITEGRDRFFGESAELFRMTKQVIGKLEAFLDVASSANIISPMNAGILKTELRTFEKDIEDEQSANMERRLFPLEMLLSPAQNNTSASVPVKDIKQKTEKDAIGQKVQNETPVLSRQNKTFVQRHEPANTESVQKTKEMNSEKASRRNLILEAVRKNGEVSLSDMKSVVGGVSDKTLQRELVALVEEGVLKRSGDRRWTKYSLSGLVQ